ncbi:hypothetical protein ANN_26261 [Periplaneta americana]|uniref:Uncharacterized protein n=1 Tax=Periplaneta americana TaxID=6978 RepID=A0ABQ8S5Q6_PERAM|nr:hypothetical protein ANN_26261 [Periplaneta americana]
MDLDCLAAYQGTVRRTVLKREQCGNCAGRFLVALECYASSGGGMGRGGSASGRMQSMVRQGKLQTWRRVEDDEELGGDSAPDVVNKAPLKIRLSKSRPAAAGATAVAAGNVPQEKTVQSMTVPTSLTSRSLEELNPEIETGTPQHFLFALAISD